MPFDRETSWLPRVYHRMRLAPSADRCAHSVRTFMKEQKHLSPAGATRASILMKTGACVGGTIIGYLSQFVGRRRAIVVAALLSACLIPAWILPEGERSLSASGFFIQFFIQGAWEIGRAHV